MSVLQTSDIVQITDWTFLPAAARRHGRGTGRQWAAAASRFGAAAIGCLP